MRTITEVDETNSSNIGTSINIIASMNISAIPDNISESLQLSSQVYREELINWLQIALSYLFFFVILQLSIFLPI